MSTRGAGRVALARCPRLTGVAEPRTAATAARTRARAQAPARRRRQAHDRQVERRHAVGAEAGGYRHLRQAEPVAVAERRADVRPRVHGTRRVERHRGIDHRRDAGRVHRGRERRDDLGARAGERPARRIVRHRLLEQRLALLVGRGQHVVECAVRGVAASHRGARVVGPPGEVREERVRRRRRRVSSWAATSPRSCAAAEKASR